MSFSLLFTLLLLVVYITGCSAKARKKAGHSFLKTLLGCVVIILGFLLTGNIQTLLIIVICTFGVSLVVLLPLAYLVGSLLFMLFGVVFGIPSPPPEESSKEPAKEVGEQTRTVTAEQAPNALLAYYTQSIAQGMTREQVIKNLKSVGGWSDADIAQSIPSSPY